MRRREPWASAQRLMNRLQWSRFSVATNSAQRPIHADEPLAYFITWTVYGTYLQGDERGWRKRRSGTQLPQRRLADWHQERLKYEVILLSTEQRAIVERQCQEHCDHRGWRLWEVNARTNHVHAVVSAPGYAG